MRAVYPRFIQFCGKTAGAASLPPKIHRGTGYRCNLLIFGEKSGGSAFYIRLPNINRVMNTRRENLLPQKFPQENDRFSGVESRPFCRRSASSTEEAGGCDRPGPKDRSSARWAAWSWRPFPHAVWELTERRQGPECPTSHCRHRERLSKCPCPASPIPRRCSAGPRRAPG